MSGYVMAVVQNDGLGWFQGFSRFILFTLQFKNRSSIVAQYYSTVIRKSLHPAQHARAHTHTHTHKPLLPVFFRKFFRFLAVCQRCSRIALVHRTDSVISAIHTPWSEILFQHLSNDCAHALPSYSFASQANVSLT